MSRNFELWQRGSERGPVPSQVVPATTAPPVVDRPNYFPQGEGDEIEAESASWLQSLNVLQRRWRVSLLCALAVAAAVTLVAFAMKPVYEPEARLEIDMPGSEITLENPQGGAPDFVQTKAQNLQSDSLALEVIRTLHLDAYPEFAGHTDKPERTPQAANASVRLTRAEDHALRVFANSRKVTLDPTSRVITVSVGSHDPVLAAQITNRLVNGFVESDRKARSAAIAQWQRELDDIRGRMDDSNRALASFQNANGFSTLSDNQTTFSERVIELNRQLMQAQADRIQLQTYLDRLNSTNTADGSLPQISSDPVVQQLTGRLAEAKAQLAQTLAVYGPNHPNTKKLQNEANELQQQLNGQRSRILGNLRTTYTASKAREGMLSTQMDGARKQMSVMAKFNELKREADSNGQLYAALYQKIKEVEIASTTKASSIRVVDWARVLYLPTRPKRPQLIGAGIFGGLLAGIVLAFLLENVDTRIRTPEDMRRYLGTESVSVIPVVANHSHNGLLGNGHLRPASARSGANAFLLDRPNSPESEALRGVQTSVRLTWRYSNGRARVLMVTSAVPGEGKTMLSVNLALVLAQHGSTCIVDADLRRGSVASALGVVHPYGLGDVLSGKAKLDEAFVAHSSVPRLTVLPAGRTRTDPGVLIGSAAMSDLLSSLRERFEIVVIDSSPILPVTDSRMLSVLVDGIVLVGRSGVTRREEMKRAMEIMRAARSAPVLEFVLNAAKYPGVGYEYGRVYSEEAAA